ncbi:MAG: site-specific integrase, partial [Verrucomicrobia bacterium]|nr:site-specific integrase [Verrucomicrobiota bacterium]
MTTFIFQQSRAGVKSRLWSARVRLDEWPRPRTFHFHVTDKRVAEQKLRDLVVELERETHGVGVAKTTREAWRIPLIEHHALFLSACEASRLSQNTLSKYRLSLPKLFERCGWVTIRDITAQSFTDWRDRSGLSPKSLNDFLGSMRTFLAWMQRRQLVLADPLRTVPKISNPGVGSYRRALSVEEARQLLQKAPPRRARVYLTMLYTGLRRNELNGLKWGDFDLTANPPTLRVPSSLSKNRKESI